MKIRWNALAHPGNRPDIRLSNMALYLVNPAVEMSLELYISQQLEEAITIQYERIRDARVRDTFVKRLETRLERLLAESIDWDLKEPTEAQLKYAILVAKQTGTPLPSEARKFRSEEHTSELQSLMRISYAVFCLKK